MLSDLKKIKWKNMKSIEKRFVIGNSTFNNNITCFNIILYLSNFARLLNYPKIFDKYIFYL